MNSKEALERLLMLARPCAYEVREHRNSYCDMLENTIKKDLERLEQLKELFKKHFIYSCKSHTIRKRTSNFDYEIIKEVLDNV